MQVQIRHSGHAAADPAAGRAWSWAAASSPAALPAASSTSGHQGGTDLAHSHAQEPQPLWDVVAQPSWALLTCFAVHSEVLLPLQHTVDDPGTAPIGGVVGIRGHHLHHRGACSRDKEKTESQEFRRAAQTSEQGPTLTACK